jgi:hypothetical protein
MSDSLRRRMLAEMIGTFGLVFAGTGAIDELVRRFTKVECDGDRCLIAPCLMSASHRCLRRWANRASPATSPIWPCGG